MVVIQVRTSPELMRARIAARGFPRDRWKLEHWDEFWTRFGAVTCTWEGARHVTLANDGELDVAPLVDVLDALKSV
jgi:hypothetical protein